MSDAIDRVTKLLALSASPNENEATNAAVLACRLIRENGLAVVGEAPCDDVAAWERQRRARLAALSPLEPAHVRCAQVDVSDREGLQRAVAVTVEEALPDADAISLIQELHLDGHIRWSEQEIGWAVRRCRRGTVHAGGVSS